MHGATKVINHCNNMIGLQNAMKCNASSRNSENIIQDSKKHPEKYLKWKGGPYWTSNIPFNAFIDVIMHLLFLGIVKSCKEMMTKWVRNTKITEETDNKRKRVCSVLEKWSLGWLKIINSHSGWGSENYLAFSRIMKWYYSLEIKEKEQCCHSIDDLSCKCGVEILKKLYSMIGVTLQSHIDQRLIDESRRIIKLFFS